MTTNSIQVRTGRAEVFAVLRDGWLYANWVVGTSHVRAVQAEWPQVGSRLFHCSGPWPVAINDDTVVEELDDGQRIVLRASGRPFGMARIVVELTDVGAHCLVTMHETPVSGLGKLVDGRVTETLLHRRNAESLVRLAALCERRTAP